jgi:hypothetical protein
MKLVALALLLGFAARFGQLDHVHLVTGRAMTSSLN